MCGSATSDADVDALLAGETADMVWTDPPYGIAYEGKTADRLTLRNDDLGPVALRTDLLAPAFRNARRVTRRGGAFYICSPSGDAETAFRLALVDADLTLRQQLVWVKDRFTLGRSDYQARHETILFGWADGDEPRRPPLYEAQHDTVLYGWRDGAAHTWEGGRRQDTVWECPRPRRNDVHPTMKPVSLVRRAIENSTRGGGRVLDLFAGAGSVVIAAHGAGRRALAMELDPRYVDVIARRWQEHTGVVPVLERTGDEVSFLFGALGEHMEEAGEHGGEEQGA